MHIGINAAVDHKSQANLFKQIIEKAEERGHTAEVGIGKFGKTPDVIYGRGGYGYFPNIPIVNDLSKMMWINDKQRLAKNLCKVIPVPLTQPLRSVDKILKKKNIAVLKPTYGSKGEGIYFMHKDKTIFDKDGNVLKTAPAGYGVFAQSYVGDHKCEYKSDYQFYVQRGAAGRLVLTGLTQRVVKNSLVANISQGGRALPFFRYENSLLFKKAYEFIDPLFDYIKDWPLGDFTVDTAMGMDGRFYLLEMNTKPAKRTIRRIGRRYRFFDHLLDYCEYLNDA
jgi:glutathione synthase/RimK-type ligase-like ATP-grasp enzyme